MTKLNTRPWDIALVLELNYCGIAPWIVSWLLNELHENLVRLQKSLTVELVQ
jgi:hypothetical protein